MPHLVAEHVRAGMWRVRHKFCTGGYIWVRAYTEEQALRRALKFYTV